MGSRLSIVGALLLLPTVMAWGHFLTPEDVPVDRLARNLSRYIAAHPKKAAGYYELGRVHYLAAWLKSGTLGVFGSGSASELPSVAANLFQRKPDEPASEENVTAHTRLAISNLRKAITIAPREALYHLTLGSAIEQTSVATALALEGRIPGDKPAQFALSAEESWLADEATSRLSSGNPKDRDAAGESLRQLGMGTVPRLIQLTHGDDPEVRARAGAVVKSIWMERAIIEYRAAYDLAVGADQAVPSMPLMGAGALVSHEAGASLVRAMGARSMTTDEQSEAAGITKTVAELEKKPLGAITPIVFSLARAAPLATLVDEQARVRFDLDGLGRDALWDWLGRRTAILVWDPARTGQITSGHQLFGSVTFNIFWTDGYQAMAALDDDGDGVLAGAELDGLAVWVDADGDGRSETGEVTPIEQTGIVGLEVSATGHQGVSPANAIGVRMRDGRRLPSYDWMAREYSTSGALVPHRN